MNSIEFKAPSRKLINQAQNYRHHYGQEVLYHGSGRLANEYVDRDKSKPTCNQIDVLRRILTEGLLPTKDHVARILLEEDKTISLTPDRLYARCYAERFGNDGTNTSQLEYTYGSYDYWWQYFMSQTQQGGRHIENALWLPIIAKNLMQRFHWTELHRIGDVEYHKQIWLANQVPIEENHPIVIAIDGRSVNPIKLPRGLDLFEVRSAERIYPNQIPFIEVPLRKITEVQNIVEEVGSKTPVVPMEIGETISWEKSSLPR